MNTNNITVEEAMKEIADMCEHIGCLIKEMADTIKRDDKSAQDEIKGKIKQEVKNAATKTKELKKQIKRQKRKLRG